MCKFFVSITLLFSLGLLNSAANEFNEKVNLEDIKKKGLIVFFNQDESYKFYPKDNFFELFVFLQVLEFDNKNLLAKFNNIQNNKIKFSKDEKDYLVNEYNFDDDHFILNGNEYLIDLNAFDILLKVIQISFDKNGNLKSIEDFLKEILMKEGFFFDTIEQIEHFAQARKELKLLKGQN